MLVLGKYLRSRTRVRAEIAFRPLKDSSKPRTTVVGSNRDRGAQARRVRHSRWSHVLACRVEEKEGVIQNASRRALRCGTCLLTFEVASGAPQESGRPRTGRAASRRSLCRASAAGSRSWAQTRREHSMPSLALGPRGGLGGTASVGCGRRLADRELREQGPQARVCVAPATVH